MEDAKVGPSPCCRRSANAETLGHVMSADDAATTTHAASPAGDTNARARPQSPQTQKIVGVMWICMVKGFDRLATILYCPYTITVTLGTPNQHVSSNYIARGSPAAPHAKNGRDPRRPGNSRQDLYVLR